MGNLIKDFWTYTYKEKSYFGVVEIIKGDDLSQTRYKRKYETHIQKALSYTMDNDVLSHMSIQTYCTWLKKRAIREDNEQKYYPFVLEFESKQKNVAKREKEYVEVVLEVAVYVQHLISQLSIDKEDICIMINNSKSIYVFVNPKVYSAKPEKDQHLIYYEMYLQLKKELSFKYVDESIVSSGYKLMKTPNTYYKNGYFVPITIQELMQLLAGNITKNQLTVKKRSLDREIPGTISLKASKLYSNAAKKVKYGYVKKDTEGPKEFKCGGNCVQYFLQHFVEKGYRNFGLVSVAIYLKSLGYTEEQVVENLRELAESWNHDESHRAIQAKVRCVFRNDYKFSCQYAQSVFSDMGIENMCLKCPYRNKKKVINDGVEIDQIIINRLWSNNASTRHYLLYLDLAKKGLFNSAFDLKAEGINERTLKELCKLSLLVMNKVDGQAIIQYKASKRLYRLPKSFFDGTVDELGNYIKHYLKLFVKGYKAVEEYILIKSSRETLMAELNYTDVSALNKLLKRLKDIGLIKYNVKTSSLSLYYSSYKVININSDPEDKEEVIVKEHVVGEQLYIKDIENIDQNFKFSTEKIINIYRGSPPD